MQPLFAYILIALLVAGVIVLIIRQRFNPPGRVYKRQQKAEQAARDAKRKP